MSAPISHKRRSVPGPRHLQWALCEVSGKRGYFSKASARVAKARQRGYGALRIYRCAHCRRFHLGHLAAEVVSGDVSRAERYGSDGRTA